MISRCILHVEISTAEAALEKFARTWERLERGETTPATESLGFHSLSAMLSTLTAPRWELIQTLKRRGPMTIEVLADAVAHDTVRVRSDVEALVNLGIMQRNDDQRISVPWDEIDLRVPLVA